MDLIWAALADPHRRAMLDALRDGPCPVGDLAGALGLSQPMTSKHLRVLRDAGLVLVRKQAQQRIYAVNPRRAGPSSSTVTRTVRTRAKPERSWSTSRPSGWRIPGARASCTLRWKQGT